jgi:hypothetical protein
LPAATIDQHPASDEVLSRPNPRPAEMLRVMLSDGTGVMSWNTSAFITVAGAHAVAHVAKRHRPGAAGGGHR